MYVLRGTWKERTLPYLHRESESPPLPPPHRKSKVAHQKVPGRDFTPGLVNQRLTLRYLIPLFPFTKSRFVKIAMTTTGCGNSGEKRFEVVTHPAPV